MFQIDSLEKWSDAHVFYDMYLQARSNCKPSKCTEDEITWRKRLLESPNGKLLLNNTMFDTISSSDKTYLLHATTKLKLIQESGSLYSSAGCLVGSIYCTPLKLNKTGNFAIHNLGKYLIEEEARNSIQLRKDDAKLDILIIEVKKDVNSYSGLVGIDYTRLGKIHFEIYDNLKYLLSKQEAFKLQSFTINKIKESVKFLSLVNRSYINNEKLDPEEFYTCLLHAIKSLPILGYLYFEVVSEYVMLFGQNEEYKEALSCREFYNFDYKNFMFTTYQNLLKNFNLGMFTPTPQVLRKFFEKRGDFDVNHMLDEIQKRLIFVINSRLLSKLEIDWHNIPWEYEDMIDLGFEPLIGHLIHRELRNFNRYQDFYFYFDQFKALQIWNYWNHMGIQLPFNGIIPKGEIGVNPAYPNLKYKVFLGSIKDKNIVELGNPLDIQIVPRLVDLKNTFMRVQCSKV